VADGEGISCCKLPVPLTVCPCCGAGIKFSRSWTWIDADKLFPNAQCQRDSGKSTFCPLASGKLGRIGLLWIGESFYKTPADFNEEAARQGISRRIATVPRQFKLGETWVAFAHIHCIPSGEKNGKPGFAPGIFRIFRPKAVEYVVAGTETEEELAALVKRGITPVKVEHAGEPELAFA